MGATRPIVAQALMGWSRGERVTSLRDVLVYSSVLIIGGLVIIALYKMMHEIDYEVLVGTLRSMPGTAFVAALGATVASYAVLMVNDFLALRYAGARPALTATLLASFCGYALGNAIGLGSLSGGAVRYRVYACGGLSPAQIARVTIFIAAAFALGASATAALGLAMRAREITQLLALPPLPLRGVASLVLGLNAAFLVVCATRRTPLRFGPLNIKLPSYRLVLAQLAITVVDIVVAAASFWVLLPAIRIDFVSFVTIYAVALGLGVLSHAPAGLGVFEAVLFYAIGAEGPPSAVVAALIAYRAIYYLLPLTVATALLAGSEIRRYLGGTWRAER